MPEWNEWYVVIYMVGLALEKLREVIYAGRLNVGFVSSFWQTFEYRSRFSQVDLSRLLVS